ncbi:MAG TPA: hypothetical protein PLY90_12210 [Candidatus Hydrogenedentes bacterium]|nr:hypothetical protein [Candidatus Hydrogenedentota bacterium]HQB04039.1 hypothetical protein [Candidatus Hydrogenedentota bacterium]
MDSCSGTVVTPGSVATTRADWQAMGRHNVLAKAVCFKKNLLVIRTIFSFFNG